MGKGDARQPEVCGFARVTSSVDVQKQENRHLEKGSQHVSFKN